MKIVSEGIEDVLKPKERSEITASLEKNNSAQLNIAINRACIDFWKKEGIRFDEEMSIDEINKIADAVSRRILTNNKIFNNEIQTCIPKFAVLTLVDQNTMAIMVYGNLPLKNGKYSESLNRIIWKTYSPDLAKKEFYI